MGHFSMEKSLNPGSVLGGNQQPRGLDHVHAAAAPMSGLTAWQYLIELGHSEPNPLQPGRHDPVPLEGKSVMINGAGGGVAIDRQAVGG